MQFRQYYVARSFEVKRAFVTRYASAKEGFVTYEDGGVAIYHVDHIVWVKDKLQATIFKHAPNSLPHEFIAIKKHHPRTHRVVSGVSIGVVLPAVLPSDPQELYLWRDAGWSIAVHNDYRLNGVAHTFYLLTHECGLYLKGEGKTDGEALMEAYGKLRGLIKPLG